MLWWHEYTLHDISLCSLQIVFIAVAIFYMHTRAHTHTHTLAYARWVWRVTRVGHITLLKFMLTAFQCKRVSGRTCYAYAVLHTNEPSNANSTKQGSAEQ